MKTISYGFIFIALCTSLAVMPASALDFTLEIFGNSNMDDTIDELDIEYVQGILDGSNEVTELADANYDGTIDEEDIAQIELIIGGNEKELTIADNNGRIVTINHPADKVVCFYRTPEHLVAIGAKDTIVGAQSKYILPEFLEGAGLADIADVGSNNEPNYEKILELMPDLVISSSPLTNPARADEVAAHLPDEIPVAGIDFYITVGEPRYNNMMMLGYIVDHEDEARELVDWMQRYENTLVERTMDLTSDEKPTVLSIMGSSAKVQTTTHGAGIIETHAGGRNLADEVVPANAGYVEVSNEWIVEQDPDVIFVSSSIGFDTTTENAEAMLKEFIDKPGWDRMSAVVNDRVYLIEYSTMINRYVIGGCYIAKCIHPELFEDMDPKEINKEYFEDFLGIKAQQGVWIYPEPPSS